LKNTLHLGSITHVVNAANNTLLHEYSYDAWGRMRNTANWNNYSPGSEPVLFVAGRGFTGHEHLPWFNLINMNGRLYDPLTAQFLSPDNYVQLPDFTQNFNRYSYCLNNPLVYTDPEGEWIFTILAAIFCPALLPVAIGTDIGWMTGGMKSMEQGKGFWYGAWRGGVVGAVGGGLSMIGGAGMSFAANLGLGTAEGAVTGGLDAALWGNDVGKGMLWGAAGGALLTTATSENMKNLFKGEGFYTNENVFNNMMERGMGKQEILNYFGFKADYVAERTVDGLGTVGGKAYYGSTNPVTGNIKIGDLAFSSYDNLKGTYTKELFTHFRVTSGKELALYPDWQSLGDFGKNIKYFPEEALGFRNAFYNMGLYPGSSINYLSLANSYWFQSYYSSLMRDKAWYNFIFRIPRRW